MQPSLTRLTLHQGIYAGVMGPQYETPAEVKMLRSSGADAIGMSTVCETIQARALGLEVAAFSCLTNWAAGLNPVTLSHAEVLAAGKENGGDFLRLLEAHACRGTETGGLRTNRNQSIRRSRAWFAILGREPCSAR